MYKNFTDHGHKNVRNLPYGFKIYLVNIKTMRIIVQILWPSQKSWTLRRGLKIFTFLLLIKPCICIFSITVIAEQNEIKRCWQKQSIIISKIHSLGRILLLKQENQFFKKERNPVSYIHRGCKLIMKFQGKQGIPTLGSKELKRNADSWGPNGFRTEAKIGY